MKRLGFLLASQVLALAAGLLFPIIFVRLNGHAAFGELILAASYSGLALSLLVAGVGQSILRFGLSFARLVSYSALLALTAMVGWGLQVVAPHGGLWFYASVPYILAAQSALYIIYYYAIRQGLSAVFAFILPIETLVRIGAVMAAHALGQRDLVVLAGVFVASNVIVGSVALGVIGLTLKGGDPEPDARIRTGASTRFMRWTASGAVLDNFDRSIYAALLPALSRSPFLFFHNLYFVAFGLVANTVILDVLGSRTRGLTDSRRGLLLIIGGGLALAALCTAALFALAAPVSRATGFDPRWAPIAILYGGAYRGALFVQFMSYGYMERAGLTERNMAPRLISSVVLLAALPAAAIVPLNVLAAGSLVVASIVAVMSLRLALAATGPRAP